MSARAVGGTTPSLQQALVLGSLGAVTALAWIVIAVAPGGAHGRSALMPHQAPFALATYGAALGIWLAMAVAMMLPPLVPWIRGFAALSEERGEAANLSTHAFVMGYLAVWSGWAVVAALMQLGIPRLVPDWPATDWMAGGALVGAGAYQLTSLKCATLNHCRSPLSFLLLQWENGPVGAFRLGWRHGLYCLGCCWALMALALALGAMNLLWMVVLTGAIGIEKLTPRGQWWRRAFGLAMIVCGGWFVVASIAG